MTAGNLFDVTKIIKLQNTDEIKDDLYEYVSLDKSSGNLEPDVCFDDIEEEYKN